ncbi:hypothetical protein [Xenorhabdus bovienii]|uniref:hypothetical protein n=1 Tax=Xenorhabdus bovienii TaxID=40576 RepID=UPI0023B2E5ED|nr:hypothetical protein [Xenorhabdus bovienii]
MWLGKWQATVFNRKRGFILGFCTVATLSLATSENWKDKQTGELREKRFCRINEASFNKRGLLII